LKQNNCPVCLSENHEQMKTPIFLLSLLAVSILTLPSCKPEGTGGSSEIALFVKHHSAPIPGATVYIKYGTSESPGTTASSFDDAVMADADGHAHFHDLVKGDYYLYGVGFDSSISQVVMGGVPVKLKNGEEKEVTVAVTE
jgi:hypothetical protein